MAPQAFRKHWRSPSYWRWYWHNQVSASVKIPLVLGLIAALLVGGYFAAGNLGGASASDTPSSYVLETTVTKIVTVRRNGKTIIKKVPVVVRRVVVRSRTNFSTLVATRVITTPGGTRYVERKVTRYVPVVHKRVVTVNGKTSTVTETRLVPTVKTLTNVVTNQQTITNQNTVVVDRTATVEHSVTNVETTTITLPARTVRETVTETVTPDPVTITITPDPVTTTVTVTDPGP